MSIKCLLSKIKAISLAVALISTSAFLTACPTPTIPAPTPDPVLSNCDGELPTFLSTRGPIRRPLGSNTLNSLYWLILPFGTLANHDYPHLVQEDGSEIEIDALYPDILTDRIINEANDRFDTTFANNNPYILSNIFGVLPSSNALFNELCELEFNFSFWAARDFGNLELTGPFLNAFTRNDLLAFVEMLSGTHEDTEEHFAIDVVDNSNEIRIQLWFAPESDLNNLRMGTLSGNQIWAALIQKIALWQTDGILEPSTHFPNLELIKSRIETIIENEYGRINEDINEYVDSGYFDTSLSSAYSAYKTYVWRPRAFPFTSMTDIWQAVGFAYWASQHPLQLQNIERLTSIEPEQFHALIDLANRDLGQVSLFKTVSEEIEERFERITSVIVADPSGETFPVGMPEHISKIINFDDQRYAFVQATNRDGLQYSKLYKFNLISESWQRIPGLHHREFQIFSESDCHSHRSSYYCLVNDTSESSTPQVYQFNLVALEGLIESEEDIVTRSNLEDRMLVDEASSIIGSFSNIELYRMTPSLREEAAYALFIYDGLNIYYWDPMLADSPPLPLVDPQLGENEKLITLNYHFQTDAKGVKKGILTLITQTEFNDESEARNRSGERLKLESSYFTIKQVEIDISLVDEEITEAELWENLEQISLHRSLLYKHSLKRSEVRFLPNGMFLIHPAGSSTLALFENGSLHRLKVETESGQKSYHLYDVYDPEINYRLRDEAFGRQIYWPLDDRDLEEESGYEFAFRQNQISKVLYPGDWITSTDKGFLDSFITIDQVHPERDGSLRIDFILNWNVDFSIGDRPYMFIKKSITIE